MGIMATKETDKNVELTERINADLRARMQESSASADKDFAENSEYVKDLEKTGKFSWIWFVLIALAVVALICIVLI